MPPNVPQQSIATQGEGVGPSNRIGLREQGLHKGHKATRLPHREAFANEVDVQPAAVPKDLGTCGGSPSSSRGGGTVGLGSGTITPTSQTHLPIDSPNKQASSHTWHIIQRRHFDVGVEHGSSGQ